MSNWPTIPAFSANNFLDHFTSLDGTKWTSAGTGTFTNTDSYEQLDSTTTAAAFLYRPTKIDKTKSQFWQICVSANRTSGSAGLDWLVALLNGASAPAADTSANITAKTLVSVGFGGGTTPTQLHPWYWDTGGTQIYYNRATDAWTSTYPGNSNLAIIGSVYDDYYVIGFENDGINSRFRFYFWHQSAATANTYTFEQGWRLFSQTAWVNWSSVRSNSDVWLTIGQPANNASGNWTTKVEWVRYAEAPSGNTVVDGWVASKSSSASAHQFKHIYTYDGVVWLPQDSSTWALALGAGSPDNSEINEPRVVYDGVATDYLFYTGTSSGTKSICVASAAHVAANTGQNATFTRYGSNPIISLGSAGAFDDLQIGFPFVVKDDTESDPNKRWKMLYGAQKNSTGVRSIGYATAPSPTGTWTKQGAVLTLSSSYTSESAVWGMSIVKIGTTWEVWYEDHDTNGVSSVKRATGTDLASLTPDGSTYHSPASNGDQALTANLSTFPGRTVTVGDTTGFAADTAVILSQSTDNDTWSTSKVRKVTSATQLELYHGVQGFATTYPARIKSLDTSPNWTPRALVQVGSEWWLYHNEWEPWLHGANSASYGSLHEETWIFTHSATTPSGGTFAVQRQPSPVVSRSNAGGQRSFENFTLLSIPVPLELFPTSRLSMHHYRRDVFRRRRV